MPSPLPCPVAPIAACATCATCTPVALAGLPGLALALPCGDRVVVALQGAQVLSWVSAGQERLYLSPLTSTDGHTAIRGGVPVCFPQFNQRGPHAQRLPKHGFARNLAWQASPPNLGTDTASVSLHLADTTHTRALWPHAFALALRVDLRPGELRVGLQVRNTGDAPLAFTGALHTYLAVPDVRDAALQGLGGQPEWDALTDVHARGADPLRFGPEFDRVYTASAHPLTLNHTLRITQSPSWGHTVVWNPGADVCAQLSDMPPDGWQHMLCAEAAQVDAPIAVPAGGQWQGWQCLQVYAAPQFQPTESAHAGQTHHPLP